MLTSGSSFSCFRKFVDLGFVDKDRIAIWGWVRVYQFETYVHVVFIPSWSLGITRTYEAWQSADTEDSFPEY